MRRQGVWLYGCVLALMVSAQPALAAGIVCRSAHDAVDDAICADHRLYGLDARLSSVYAALLERDPTRAQAIRQDERAWLGERDLAALLPTNGHGSADTQALAHAYVERIAFLRGVDNPDMIRGSPVARTLLTAAYDLPADTSDALLALHAAGIARLAQPQTQTGLAAIIAALPAPPNAALQRALQQLAANYFDGHPYYSQTSLTLVSMPASDSGGVYRIEGSAGCMWWIMFRQQGDVTEPVVTPRMARTSTCGRREDLASVDGYPVLISEQANFDAGHTDLTWQRYLGAGNWGLVTRIRIRFAPRITAGSPASCRVTAIGCAMVPSAAEHAARAFEANVATLLHPAWLSAADNARYTRMLATTARNYSPNCETAVWFPARVAGHLLVGMIDRSHVACHPFRSLNVAFWQVLRDKPMRVARDTVTISNGQVLLAARVPLRPGARHPWYETPLPPQITNPLPH